MTVMSTSSTPRCTHRAWLGAPLWLGLVLAGPAGAQSSATPDLAPLVGSIQTLSRQALGATLKARVEVEVGTLDPRLRLAPCQRIEPYLPPGLPAWGRTRVGMRCVEGPKAWNVTLPITVHVWTPVVVTTETLAAGTQLQAQHLQTAERDLAAGAARPVLNLNDAIGRTLARTLPAGTAVAGADLKSRQWFAAGDTVRVVAVGPGWRIQGEAQALTPGLEGQTARARTESGRVVQGRPTGEREMEVSL